MDAVMKFLFLLLVTASVSAQTVYKTPSGKKYHTADCRTVKNTSEAISVADALRLGLQPCKICKPNAGKNSTTVSDNVSGEKTVSTQCKGKTKAGARCKHMTKIANGYCFQHQSQQ